MNRIITQVSIDFMSKEGHSFFVSYRAEHESEVRRCPVKFSNKKNNGNASPLVKNNTSK